MAPRGKPFTKGDPRAAAGRKLAGRKPKSVTWKEAEEALREAVPRLLLMPKHALAALLQDNPTGVEMLAAKYIHEHAVEAVNRFLGKVAEHVKSELTGKDGAPLVPEIVALKNFSTDQLLKLIEATVPKAAEGPK